MRFRRIFLERFGHFTDTTIDLGPKPEAGPDFVVLYGLNEAGKSTLLAVIRRLLFGFPARSETYGFLHGSELKVGAEIEGLPGRDAISVWRVRKNSALLDVDGRRVDDGLFDAALGGLQESDYRKIFSLDRETVEDGATELSEGKGATARAFFAAHTGLSSLTSRLAEIDEQAQDLFKPAGRRDRARNLLKEIEHHRKEAKEADMTASAFATLRRKAVDAARQRTRRAEELRDARTRAQAVERLIRLRDDGATLESKRRELDTYGSLPDWPSNPHPKSLVELNGDIGGLEAKRTTLEEEIAEIETRIEGTVIDEAVLACAERIEALAAKVEGEDASLPVGASGAAAHLVKRRAEAEEMAAAMRRRLGAVLIDGGGPLREDRVLEREPMEGLRCAAAALDGAETDLEAKRDRLDEAEKDLADLARDRAEDLAEPELSQETAHALAALDLDTVREDAASARDDVRRQAEALREALAAIQTAGRGFTAAPETELTPAAVRAAGDERNGRDHDARTGQSRMAALDWEIAAGEAEIARRKARLGVTDLEASLARRDAAWTRHRTTLDDATASTFEAEMRRHDLVVDQRFAQAQELGAVNEAAADLEKKRRERAREAEKTQEAETAIAALDGLHEEALAALGLPKSFTGEELATWLDEARHVRECESRLAAREALARDPLDRSAAVARRVRELVPRLREGEETFALTEGAALLATHRVRLAAREVAEAALRREEGRVAASRMALDTAEAALTTARTRWHEAVERSLPADHGLRDVREAVGVLAEVSSEGVLWRQLHHRIGGLRRDAVAYLDAMAAIDDGLGEFSAQENATDPAALDDRALIARVNQALTREEILRERLRKARETARELARDRETLEKKRASLRTLGQSIVEVEGAIDLYRAPFPPGIDTSTLQALEAAVRNASDATALRTDVRQRREALAARLNPDEGDDPESFTYSLRGRDLEVELSVYEAEVKAAEETFNEAYSAASKAEDALRSVDSADRAARANAAKAAAEETLVETLLAAARKRMGLQLARAAIDAYREENRSEAMQAATRAFRGLTRGRYNELSSRSEAGLEKLVARRSEDGAERIASELSAGTRMQLFHALRLAAYRDYARRGISCPFVADDVFESFDDYRTEAACQEMREIGTVGQSIYLTHHSEVGRRALAVCAGFEVIRFMPGVPEADRGRLTAIQ